MDDILPGHVHRWQWLEDQTKVFFRSLGYQKIRTPILEPTELFSRSIGETTDIVHKEMYTLEDRGGRSMTMRPEMTASVARAMIQSGLLRGNQSWLLYYLGPMFRAERPQAGRKRQFHQIGAEIVNGVGQDYDVKIIEALYRFLEFLGLKQPKLRINDLTLINGKESETIRARLKDYFASHRDQLDKDSLYRLDKNVLRIFDSKEQQCQAIINAAPWDEIAPFSENFLSLVERLKKSAMQVEVSRRLVRGLDYYDGIVFEVCHEGLGAQDAVAGGGRYDHLYRELGAADIPCTGFSIGMERLLLALEAGGVPVEDRAREKSVYLVSLDSAAAANTQRLAFSLSRYGFQVEIGEPALHLSDQLKKANKKKARFVLIQGAEESAADEWTLKFMDQKEQIRVQEKQVLDKLLQATGEGN